jgi:protein gp37
MSSKSKIEWTDATWNPIVGCSRVSPGCSQCYAAIAAASARLQQFKQYQEVAQWDGTVVFVENQLLKPFTWKKPKKIFVCSMSDLFHPNIADEWRDQIFAVMAINSQHTFQVLTKRPENAVKYFANSNRARWICHRALDIIRDEQNPLNFKYGVREVNIAVPLSNVWIGVTVENQAMASHRIPLLQQIPAALRWLSVEPLLEAVEIDFTNIDWCVVGGESGSGYRECKVEWIESIASQCAEFNLPLFVKQDSGYHSGKQGKICDYLWSFKQFPSTLI